MKNILVISFSDMAFDARVSRQLRWLNDDAKVTCVCFGENLNISDIEWKIIKQTPLGSIRKVLLTICLLLRCYRLAYRLQHGYQVKLKDIQKERFDWIFANDIEAVPLAFQLKGNKDSKIYFDAHEYAPRHFEDKRWWRILFAPWYRHLCRKFIPLVDQMTTVSKGLAEEYHQHFGRMPEIVTNATKYHNLDPSSLYSPIRLVHHGIFNRSRKIENMLEVMQILGDGYSLDLILMLPEYASEDTKKYFTDMQQVIDKMTNVRLLEPMENHEIVPFINQYDVGLFLLEPINFNYTYALPNKLFDFIQARLAIAIGPSVEMAHYVKKYDLGVVSSSFSPTDLAISIREIELEKLAVYKSNSHSIALDLSEEANRDKMYSLIQ